MDRSILPFNALASWNERPDSSYMFAQLCTRLYTLLIFTTLAINDKSRQGKKENDFSRSRTLVSLGA